MVQQAIHLGPVPFLLDPDLDHSYVGNDRRSGRQSVEAGLHRSAHEPHEAGHVKVPDSDGATLPYSVLHR
jgi:hypothetical protein